MSMLDGVELTCAQHPEIVHEHEGKWYFWIETWADRNGPYDTREECQKELDRYCKEVLGCED